MSYYLVAVNSRYKEYYAVESDDGKVAVELALELEGIEVPSLKEFVETMDVDGFDDPEKITEEKYRKLISA